MTPVERRARQEAVQLSMWLTPMVATVQVSALAEDQSEDQGTGNDFGSDGSALPDLGALSPLGSWASVAATIQRKAQQLANFDPTATSYDPVAWEGYLYKLATAPFWLDLAQNNREVKISSLSLDKTIDAISDLITTVATDATFDSVVTSIKKIATVALNNQGQSQKDNFQQQGLISVKNSVMTVANLRTSVQMQYKSGKGYEQLTQEINIQRWYGTLDYEKCKRSAETILSWDKTDVDEWASNSNSVSNVPNDSPAWNS